MCLSSPPFCCAIMQITHWICLPVCIRLQATLKFTCWLQCSCKMFCQPCLISPRLCNLFVYADLHSRMLSVRSNGSCPSVSTKKHRLRAVELALLCSRHGDRSCESLLFSSVWPVHFLQTLACDKQTCSRATNENLLFTCRKDLSGDLEAPSLGLHHLQRSLWRSVQ